jgi:hypothetical protein
MAYPDVAGPRQAAARPDVLHREAAGEFADYPVEIPRRSLIDQDQLEIPVFL